MFRDDDEYEHGSAMMHVAIFGVISIGFGVLLALGAIQLSEVRPP